MARVKPKSRTSRNRADQSSADCTALYIRVSTSKQADEGFSLSDQESRLRSYCDAQAWTVCPDHVYIDAGESGKTDDRPAYRRMMEAAQRGEIVRIVAMKLDRLSRNVRDFLALVDELSAVGCDLVLLKESFDTSTPHGKFALTLFAAMGELEAATIAERTTAGRRQKAREGGYNGSPAPLGYVYTDGQFEIVESEAATVEGIFNEFCAGGSLSGIARRLNESGTPTKTGAKWYPSTVRHIVNNGAYAGLTQYGEIETEEGAHPVIVTVGVYDAATSRLACMKPGRPKV